MTKATIWVRFVLVVKHIRTEALEFQETPQAVVTSWYGSAQDPWTQLLIIPKIAIGHDSRTHHDAFLIGDDAQGQVLPIFVDAGFQSLGIPCHRM